MKTIEERAIEALEDFDDAGYSAGLYMGYIEGAAEQMDIDNIELSVLKSALEKESSSNLDIEKHYKQGCHDTIEKACNWLKENIEGGVHPQSVYGFVQKFRKAMER